MVKEKKISFYCLYKDGLTKRKKNWYQGEIYHENSKRLCDGIKTLMVMNRGRVLAQFLLLIFG